VKVRRPYRLPADKEAVLRHIVRLEWTSLAFRLSFVLVLYLVMGNSQAMKAAWLEDIITLLPPIAFLVAMRFRNRPPNTTFPYGYGRAAMIAFLFSAIALSALGLYLIIDSMMKLIKMEHTSIGAIRLFGETFWSGWLMIAGLTYTVIPPFIIGRMQEAAAKQVHEKTVHVDAKMNKADWTTGVAGIVGVLGVGLGLWWADALAAALIGLDIFKDGFVNTREAVGDLLDRRPHFTTSAKPEHMEEKLEKVLRSMDWVADAEVRLREEGHVFSGEAFVVPRNDQALTERLRKATDTLVDYDWRIHEIIVTVLRDPGGTRPGTGSR
jgi:cation diffusion facilitator family transporter